MFPQISDSRKKDGMEKGTGLDNAILEVIKSVYELRGKANAGLKVWR